MNQIEHSHSYISVEWETSETPSLKKAKVTIANPARLRLFMVNVVYFPNEQRLEIDGINITRVFYTQIGLEDIDVEQLKRNILPHLMLQAKK